MKTMKKMMLKIKAAAICAVLAVMVYATTLAVYANGLAAEGTVPEKSFFEKLDTFSTYAIYVVGGIVLILVGIVWYRTRKKK